MPLNTYTLITTEGCKQLDELAARTAQTKSTSMLLRSYCASVGPRLTHTPLSSRQPAEQLLPLQLPNSTSQQASPKPSKAQHKLYTLSSMKAKKQLHDLADRTA
jgi:hypothetical protein